MHRVLVSMLIFTVYFTVVNEFISNRENILTPIVCSFECPFLKWTQLTFLEEKASVLNHKGYFRLQSNSNLLFLSLLQLYKYFLTCSM